MLKIRSITQDDAEAIHAIYEDREVVRNTLRTPYASLALYKQFLQNIPDQQKFLVACNEEGEAIGEIALSIMTRRRHHVAHIGMVVKRGYRRQGVGSTLLTSAIDLAYNWFGLTRLELEVFTDNIAAIKLYEKFGFVIEGTSKAYALREGSYDDVHIMALLKTDN